MSKSPEVQIEPFAIPPKETARIDRCGITEVYRRINDGEYESYLDGSKRMITLRSIRARQERQLKAATGAKRPAGPGRPKKQRKP